MRQGRAGLIKAAEIKQSIRALGLKSAIWEIPEGDTMEISGGISINLPLTMAVLQKTGAMYTYVIIRNIAGDPQ
jgi:hypothetical protein